MAQEHTVLETDKSTALAGAGLAGPRVAKTTILEDPNGEPLQPCRIPQPGGAFLDLRVVAPMKVSSGEADFFMLEAPETGTRHVLKLYRYGVRPKTAILDLVMRLGGQHVVKVIRHGEVECRHYEIQEYLPHGSLADLLARGHRIDEARVRLILSQVTEALQDLQAYSVLHRDVKPSNILIRSLEPLCLVLSDFGISSVSDLSLHLTTLSRTPAYCAPEAATGVVSKASDWWSLGVITLEMLMGAHPFEGMTEQTISFQIISRGVTVPESLAPEWAQLLRGLLTRNYRHRWEGAQVRRWLAGDRDVPIHSEAIAEPRAAPAHKPYRFLETSCFEPSELAEQLARHWPEASKHWAMGYILRWIENEVGQQQLSSVLREIQRDPSLPAGCKLGAALLAMHPDLPLVVQGNVLDEAACSADPQLASDLAKGSLGIWLARLRQNDWLRRWVEEYRAAEQALLEWRLELNSQVDFNSPFSPVGSPDPLGGSTFQPDRLKALLCAPLASVRKSALERRALFAGTRGESIAKAFEDPNPGRVASLQLLLAPDSMFFTEAEAMVERGLKASRAFGWRLDETLARRLWANPEWSSLKSHWQKAALHTEERSRTPLALADSSMAEALRQSHPPVDAAIAILANRLGFENSLGMRFVPAPGARTLWSIWQTRVGDFDAFLEEHSMTRKAPSFEQAPDHPVVLVSWDDAAAFCEWLTSRERNAGRIGPRDFYRLPSDSEWTRMTGLKGEPGGTPRERNGAIRGIFPWGTDWPPPINTHNLGAALQVDPFPFTAPVGRFAANELGLHDLGSNVMEWCGDSYDVDLDLKVVRGASWYHATPENCWTSVRRRFSGREKSDTLGFRCALDYRVPPPTSFLAIEIPRDPVVNQREPSTRPPAPGG